MGFPKLLYLDTNILKSLRRDLNTPEFQELKKVCDDLSISICAPQIVEDELIAKYIDEELNGPFQKIESQIAIR